jgi:hypothetical protein
MKNERGSAVCGQQVDSRLEVDAIEQPAEAQIGTADLAWDCAGFRFGTDLLEDVDGGDFSRKRIRTRLVVNLYSQDENADSPLKV